MSYKGFSWVNWAVFPPCPSIGSMGHINLPHENSVPPWVSPQGGREEGHLNPRPPSSGASLLSWMSAPTPGPLNVSLQPNSTLSCLTYRDWVSALAAVTSAAPGLMSIGWLWDCLWWRPRCLPDSGALIILHSLHCPFLSGLQQQGYVAWIILDSTVSVTWCLVHAIQPQLSCPVSPE